MDGVLGDVRRDVVAIPAGRSTGSEGAAPVARLGGHEEAAVQHLDRGPGTVRPALSADAVSVSRRRCPPRGGAARTGHDLARTTKHAARMGHVGRWQAPVGRSRSDPRGGRRRPGQSPAARVLGLGILQGTDDLLAVAVARPRPRSAWRRGSASSAAARSSGTFTVRGWVSSDTSTSSSSPAATPDAARCSALMPTMNTPPITATVFR